MRACKRRAPSPCRRDVLASAQRPQGAAQVCAGAQRALGEFPDVSGLKAVYGLCIECWFHHTDGAGEVGEV